MIEINKIYNEDCRETMSRMPDNFIDSIVTDPPYELGFMGKKWDNSGIAYNVELWKECLRVLKPGGYLLAFGGTRTSHRMICAIEDAGFEIRDSILWLYGQGFPKSLDINKQFCNCKDESKKISKHNLRSMQNSDISQTVNPKDEQGEILQSVLQKQSSHKTVSRKEPKESTKTTKQPSMEGGCDNIQEKRELQERALCEKSGMGKADGKEGRLYNATSFNNGNDLQEIINEDGNSSSQEPQSDRQRPNESGIVAEQLNSQKSRTWEICGKCKKPISTYDISGLGTALKPAHEPICVARKPLSEKTVAENVLKYGTGGININGCRIGDEIMVNSPAGNKAGGNSLNMSKYGMPQNVNNTISQGRFPANIILDPFTAEELDKQVPEAGAFAKVKSGHNGKSRGIYGDYATRGDDGDTFYDDKGGASRFFYIAKADSSERNEGLYQFEKVRETDRIKTDGPGGANPRNRSNTNKNNFHPTVKPIKLIQYLQRLVTPKGGLTYDPFGGSGTSALSAINEGFNWILSELIFEHCDIANKRIYNKGGLFLK